MLLMLRVVTDMQHHMFSLNTIKRTVSIYENIKISYVTGLLFIVLFSYIPYTFEISFIFISITSLYILLSLISAAR
jgi:hypothetical protein